tara:strand:- start:11903 stop:13339 length:1437 start_codon:yes stop_codon:yes gene_type:complete
MSFQKQATKGVVWTFTQQFGNQIIGFVVSLVLARILLPEEFGLIGMIAVFISIGQSLVHSGLTQSLIRTKELDQQDYSTVFFFNIIASIIAYLIVYVSAPYIAEFYDQEILQSIARLYGLVFIINSLSAVQLSKYSREMNFKTPAIAAVPANLIGGIVGIFLAYSDYGVWSIVWSQLINAFFNSLFIWLYSDWRPSMVFNFEKFKKHLNFGYKLTLTGLLDTFFRNSYLIIIGKIFSPAQVGYYTRAETLKQLPVVNISSALNSVTYPMFASIQNDDIKMKRVYKELMQIVLAIISPILIFLAVLAEPTFVFLFTDKWLPAVPYFQILCVTGILFPIHAYNLNILKVKGRTDLILKLEFLKKTVIVITILISVQFGILALLYGQIFTSIVAFIINSYYTGKFIDYDVWEQTGDVIPILLIASAGGLAVYFLDNFFLQSFSNILRIILGGCFGILVYLGFIYKFKTSLIVRFKSIISNK